jgi:hypothetical protein
MAFRQLADDMKLWEMEREQPEYFVEAARIFARLRGKGVTIPPTDCLIAAVAIRKDSPLYARDPDCETIPGLRLLACDMLAQLLHGLATPTNLVVPARYSVTRFRSATVLDLGERRGANASTL